MTRYQGSGLGRTFSLDGESRGYPSVALSFQGVRFVHVGIIHVNQPDRNSGGAIWSRSENRDGDYLKESIAGSMVSFCV
jgi:hypothetical protein